MMQVHVLERELTVERREVQELRADLEACKLEKRSVQRTLESTLDEKKQMSDKINQLTVNGMLKLFISDIFPFDSLGFLRVKGESLK